MYMEAYFSGIGSADNTRMTYLTIGAVKPWNSADAEPEGLVFGGSISRYRLVALPIEERTATQAEIDKCLSCPFADCCDCIGGGKQMKRGRPKKSKGENTI